MRSYESRFLWPVAKWELIYPRTCEPIKAGLPRKSVEALHAEFRLAPNGGKSVFTWEPLDEAPALYREAAALAGQDPHDVLKWVNHRGNLWWPEPGDEDIRLLAVYQELDMLSETISTWDALRGRGSSIADVRITTSPPKVGKLTVSDVGVNWAKAAARGQRSLWKFHFAWVAAIDTIASRLTVHYAP